jgi:LacI family transcriptional regulator
MVATAALRGVAIPGQLALVGYDDHPTSATMDPPLTTVRQPLDRIAFAAYQLATVDASAILERPRKLLFAPDLIARASTQRPASSAAASALPLRATALRR